MPNVSVKVIRYFCFAFCAWALGSRMWAAEDSYITFRAVENLFGGYGLVYNPGENVEVFTHPLWMAALVILRGSGIPLHAGAVGLGLILTLTGLFFISRDETKNPYTALILCSISGFRDFATAGMEFSLVFALIALLFESLDSRRTHDNPLYHSLLAGLLYLARPELALVIVFYSAVFVFEMKDSLGKGFRYYLRSELRPLLLWAAGILITAGSYHLFRWFYYDDIFPNTYYAKSGLSSYYSQGWKYLASVFLWAPGFAFLFAFVFFAPVFHRFRRAFTPRLIISYARELALATLLVVYVLRVGGDFMAFRFLLPEIAMIAMIAHRFFARMDIRFFSRLLQFQKPLPAYAGILAAVVIALGAAWPVPYSRGFIADERKVFTEGLGIGPIGLAVGTEHEWMKAGRQFHSLQRCLGMSFWITNSQAEAKCMIGAGLGYFGMAAGPGVKILDEQGLPNREVAHARVFVRYRPGHEHYISLTEVIEKGVLFCSSNEPAYDRIMATPAGILLRFDPLLLSTVPDIEARLTELQILKKNGSTIIPALERKYNITLEELTVRTRELAAQVILREKNQCWQDFGTGQRRYFY